MAKITDIEFYPATSTDLSDSTLLPELLPQFRIEVMDEMLANLYARNVVLPLMALREPFATRFVEKDNEALRKNLNRDDDEYNVAVTSLFLVSLHRLDLTKKTLEELQEIGEGVSLNYSPDEIDFIEQKTRLHCMLWYRFRAGRV